MSPYDLFIKSVCGEGLSLGVNKLASIELCDHPASTHHSAAHLVFEDERISPCLMCVVGLQVHTCLRGTLSTDPNPDSILSSSPLLVINLGRKRMITAARLSRCFFFLFFLLHSLVFCSLCLHLFLCFNFPLFQHRKLCDPVKTHPRRAEREAGHQVVKGTLLALYPDRAQTQKSSLNKVLNTASGRHPWIEEGMSVHIFKNSQLKQSFVC